MGGRGQRCRSTSGWEEVEGFGEDPRGRREYFLASDSSDDPPGPAGSNQSFFASNGIALAHCARLLLLFCPASHYLSAQFDFASNLREKLTGDGKHTKSSPFFFLDSLTTFFFCRICRGRRVERGADPGRDDGQQKNAGGSVLTRTRLQQSSGGPGARPRHARRQKCREK